MGGPALAKRSCGTCRDRRILCDRITPTCSQCARAKRMCKGYGIRLSWPRENDGRRAIVLKTFQNSIKYRNCRIGDTLMVRRSHWDIDMHMYLSSCISHAPLLHTPVSWNPHRLGEKEWTLMTYFEFEASRSLTTFGSDPKALGDMLMRVSQSGKTLASTAVLHSLLGLSSLARYGYNEQAMEFKISSLQALAKALELCDESLQAVHHIAAGMLLCSIEVHQASCSASEWTWYINGIKSVLFSDHGPLKCTIDDDEKDMLLKWVYYHDVMKRFSVRHWGSGPKGTLEKSTYAPQLWMKSANHDGTATILPHCVPASETKPSSELSDDKEIASENLLMYQTPPHSALWITATLKLMSEICDAVPTKPCYETMESTELNDYSNRIKILDWRIRNIPIPSPVERNSYPSTIVHLYQLTMLIYLHRITSNILNQGSKLQEYIDIAFTLLAELDSCKPHFPMYIIGWEARTDEQRITWLEMLERTKSNPSSRSLFHVEALVQAGWAQDDLGEKDLDYWDKVTALVRCCSTMPSFV